MSDYSLLILPGDGIGPEVMAEVRRIIDWYGAKRGLVFEVSEDLVGGAAYDVHGTPLTDATMEKAQSMNTVLLNAVGGPKYDVLDFAVKPERGLLRLRKEMDLYANLRPARYLGLPTPLKEGLARHADPAGRHPGRPRIRSLQPRRLP